MAGYIDYVGDGVIKEIANSNTGDTRKTHSKYFDVSVSKGKLVGDANGNDKYLVEPVDLITNYPKRQIADRAYRYPKMSQPIIDSTGGKSFATNSVTPFKDKTLDSVISGVNETLNIMDNYRSPASIFSNLATKKYNRYKTPNYNEILSRGFPHIFFVRPDCNILTNNGSEVVSDNKHHDLFEYAAHANIDLLQELSHSKYGGRKNDFMMSLSNRAISFNANDEAIETGEYGHTYTGYKIAYGKNDIKSKTAGNISVQFKDDRNFYIYQLIRCWVEYISGVYRGELFPRTANIVDKVLDYASAIYYIIVAEDGETILFWSKYYGVFPTSIPATQYSWSAGNTIFSPELSVEFQYSFKRDFSPYLVTEFNHNSGITSATQYEPTYDKFLNSAGKSWVGTPFIEISTESGSYELKLRYSTEEKKK